MPARTFCLPWETLSFRYSHASFVCSIICSPGHEFLGYKTQDWEEWKKSCEPLDCVHCSKAWEYFSARQSRNRQLSFLRCASESNCFLLDLGGGTHATAILLAKWATKSSKQFDRMMEWASKRLNMWLLYSCGSCFAAVRERKMLSWDALASHRLPWQGVLVGKASTRVLRATLMPNIGMGVVHVRPNVRYRLAWPMLHVMIHYY